MLKEMRSRLFVMSVMRFCPSTRRAAVLGA
jgi:hypothetical protein